MYWNEAYETCSYGEAETRLTGWLQEYQRDRAVHEKARRAHPDPTTLDNDFAVAFKEASSCQATLEYPFPTSPRALTAMLLNGARATPCRGCFDDYELSGRNLGDIVEVLRGRPDPEVEEFLDAVTTSGSVAVISNRRYAGNGGDPLPAFVLTALVSGGVWGTPCHETLSEDRDLRRVCLRLLARMSFLSAEREIAFGSTHDFMALVQTCRYASGVYPAQQIGTQSFVDPRNRDPILHVMYLMIFMYRRYPWPPDQQYHVDEEIARWIQDDDGGCRHYHVCGPILHQLTLVRHTLKLAVLLPGFFQALQEDHSVWLLLAAACTREQGSRCEAGDRATTCGGREKICWVFNAAFRSSREENNLIRTLAHNRLLSAWVCSEDGRYLLLDVCRQRRRRVVEVS